MNFFQKQKENPIESVKITILGNTNVGKTSIVKSYRGDYSGNEQNTIGAGYYATKIDNLLLEIWDISGDERYKVFSKIYYRNSHYCIIVFDIDMVSFNNAKNTCLQIERIDPNIIIILVCNKIDIYYKAVNNIKQENVLSLDSGKKSFIDQQYIDVMNRIDNDPFTHSYVYYKISAKEGINIKNLFKYIRLHHIESLQIVEDKQPIKIRNCENCSNCIII